jgi:hypothetical protein
MLLQKIGVATLGYHWLYNYCQLCYNECALRRYVCQLCDNMHALYPNCSQMIVKFKFL